MSDGTVTIENEWLGYEIGRDGRNLRFTDKRTGADYCDRSNDSHLARATKGGREHPASAVSFDGRRMTLGFGDSNVSATLVVHRSPSHVVLEVESVEGDGVEELVFLDVPLTLDESGDGPFAACALALNLETNVEKLPGPMDHLRAACYPRFGFVGAKVAIIACPPEQLRPTLQEAVSAAEELPHSPLGGPWALDVPICHGSYLFDMGDVTEETVDDWIGLVESLGFTQLDFHGGKSFRFGDCRFNLELFPKGRRSMTAVIDRLHDAGISAGLHPYAFFIDKKCPWVTPVPDPRLAKDATFTLAKPIDESDEVVHVAESTADMSAITGFFVRNSVTLQIGEELITYSGVLKEEEHAFTGCQRGAYSTRVSGHREGSPVHHLKECFGLFAPDGDSTLLAEVAQSMADTFNECGFDMMYLDALDGEDVLGGKENGWHYGSKFVFELWNRLAKPAVMEMSTFHHHLWYVRSRMGAWDHPDRSHKRFIDLHCEANKACERMFLPPHLGWWSALTWQGAKKELTLPDDIEYLCCKAIGTNAGLSLMGVSPGKLGEVPALRRLAAVIKRYEGLRLSGTVPASAKAKLREPGKEYSLVGEADDDWTFRPARYEKHKVERVDGRSNVWQVENEFGRQPLQLRIEALMSAKPYDCPGNITLAGPGELLEFQERDAAEEVSAELSSSRTERCPGEPSVQFAAVSRREHRQGAWAKVGTVFEPPLDLSGHQGLGVWIRGDGKGQALNTQLTSPEHITWSTGEHYIDIDFTGWRYFELIEPDGERYEDCDWPYGTHYSIYRGAVDYENVGGLSLWYNDLPPGEPVECHISPIKAVPLLETTLVNPTVAVGGATVRFPVEMRSGSCLEFRSASDCKLYGPKGEVLAEVSPQGDAPELAPGENEVSFTCESLPESSPRARVTVIRYGEEFRD